VPVVSISPSSAAVTRDGKIMSWDTAPLQAALSAGVMPLIFGDIVFDATQGGKVLSTEALIWHLATLIKPSRVLLAGLEAAVWEDFPDRTRPIQRITPSTSGLVMDKIGGSHGPDVTGGMKSKVAEMLALVRAVPGLTVQIFSGEQDGNIRRALRGEPLGTRVTSD
jgi:isopentenyl phosphate kinase